MPFDGVMNSARYGEPGSLVARIITPAFAHGLVLPWESTRTLIVPSVGRGWLSNRNWSELPQMSLPPPSTVQLLPITYWLPLGIG